MEEHIRKYHPLGPKTLLIFIFQKSALLLLMAPLLVAFLIGLNYVPAPYLFLALNFIFIYIIALIFIIILGVFFGWLQYYRYWIFIDEKDLKVARGLIAIEQIGIPYRFIKDIKIQRSLIDQLFGVSDVIITVLGDQDTATEERNTTVVFPAVSQEIGLEIQDIVLKRAQVEQISVIGNKMIS